MIGLCNTTGTKRPLVTLYWSTHIYSIRKNTAKSANVAAING